MNWWRSWKGFDKILSGCTSAGLPSSYPHKPATQNKGGKVTFRAKGSHTWKMGSTCQPINLILNLPGWKPSYPWSRKDSSVPMSPTHFLLKRWIFAAMNSFRNPAFSGCGWSCSQVGEESDRRSSHWLLLTSGILLWNALKAEMGEISKFIRFRVELPPPAWSCCHGWWAGGRCGLSCQPPTMSRMRLGRV